MSGVAVDIGNIYSGGHDVLKTFSYLNFSLKKCTYMTFTGMFTTRLTS